MVVDLVLGILLIVALLVAFLEPYVSAHSKVRSTLRQLAHPNFEPLDEEAVVDLPAEVSTFLEGVSETLRRLGFEEMTRLVLKGDPVHTYQLVLQKTPEQDLALATAIAAEAKKEHPTCLYTEFLTPFRDETSINTNNSPLWTAFDNGSHDKSIQFQTVRDPSLLYRVHRAAVAKYGGSRHPRVISHERIVPLLREGMLDVLRDWEERGYLFLDASEGKYRLTFKGAFLAGWNLRWPMKTFRESIRARRAPKASCRGGCVGGTVQSLVS
jgi:hypothetical protein